MVARDELPLACTLSPGTYQARLAHLAELAHEGLRAHSRQELVLDLRYAPEFAKRVREMVREEEECCAFLTFALTEAADEVRLTITAPERAREAADLLFALFLPVPRESRGAPARATCCDGESCQ